MSDVPSGWYDDPEDPTQYRYWDGSQWSEHRSPRATAGGSSSGSGLGGAAITGGWQLLKRNWLVFLAIGAAMFVAFIAVFFQLFIASNNSISPSLTDILERVTEPGFDAINDPDDEAFVESIEFNPTTAFWVNLPLIVLELFVIQVFAIGLGSIHAAADHVGRPRTIGDSFGVAMRRVPRWVGIFVVWMFAYGLVTALIAVLAIATGGLALFLLVPVGIGIVIWLYPTLYLMGTALAVGPTDEPPFRSTLAMMRAGWKRIAGPVLIVNLVVVGISIALSALGVIPILGAILSLIGNLAMYAYLTCANVVLWTRLGGRIGVDIGGGAAPVD